MGKFGRYRRNYRVKVNIIGDEIYLFRVFFDISYWGECVIVFVGFWVETYGFIVIIGRYEIDLN